jgi:hypothetical protein
MMTSDENKVAYNRNASVFRYRETGRYTPLISYGLLTAEALRAAEESAAARGIETEGVLMREFHVPRRRLLEALSDYYQCAPIEYDERLPVPPDLLADLDGERLSLSQWFPAGKSGDTVTVAAINPCDPAIREEISKHLETQNYEIRVALSEDIQWFILDFLHARPGHLVGTGRTGLAFWRNTMAQWRTRLACYRNDMAKGRTALAFLRWGLGFIAVTDALMRKLPLWRGAFFPWIIMVAGFLMASYGLGMYLKIRKSRIRPPGHHTLVEVTAATLQFLEGYHFIDDPGTVVPTKKTMLGRLGDFWQTTAQSCIRRLQVKNAPSLPANEMCSPPRELWRHATARSMPARGPGLPSSAPGFPLRVSDSVLRNILVSVSFLCSIRSLSCQVYF